MQNVQLAIVNEKSRRVHRLCRSHGPARSLTIVRAGGDTKPQG
jgi:hypothetical protein